MYLLLTNDDGVQSSGLLALKRSLEKEAEVAVFAPDRNWSAAGHSRFLNEPLAVRTLHLADGSTVLVSDGTPSDCVALALMGLLPRRPDLVISGINRGPNVGSDVTYSGTVAAAMEAVLFGVPAIAISLDGYENWDFSFAASFARRLVLEVVRRGLPSGVLLNVNVPNRPAEEIRGVAMTRLGRRIYRDAWELIEEKEGMRRYRLGGPPPTGELIPGTDLAALDAGYVSITPLHLDLTEHRFLEEMRTWKLIFSSPFHLVPLKETFWEKQPVGKEEMMIQVSNLSKWYGSFQALRDVSFRVDEGEIVGLLGPNGAGKTTMIKILTGYLHPDEGTALIGGMDILTRTREVQAIIGYLPENAPLYPELSVQGYLKMIADLRQISPDEQPERIAEAVHAVGLEDQLTRPIGQLSKGYRQRVGLAQAILHRPRILILDEPTLGLDPTQLLEARRLIRRLAGDSTILFSTHILSEVEALCNRVIILMNGEVRADARLSELASSPDAIIVLESVPAGLENSLRSLPGVRTLEPFRSPDGYPAFRVRGGAAHSANLCPAIYRLARQENWPVRELRRDVRTLETVFNQLVATA